MKFTFVFPLILSLLVPFSSFSESKGNQEAGNEVTFYSVFTPNIEIKKAPREHLTLRVYNSADYISEDPDIIEMFEEYVLEHDNVDLEVIYETFDTNETMLSRVETGSAQYDLLCPSDYMIQRMMRNGMLHPYAFGEEKTALYSHNSSLEDWPNSYEDYASPYLDDWFGKIEGILPDGSSAPLSEYAKGYMWGTLGFTYNPYYDAFEERGLTPDEVKVQINDWNVLLDDTYQGTFQIKDSMRDTYSVALMQSYDAELQVLRNAYLKGEWIDGSSYSEEQYSADVNTIFNNVTRVEEFNSLLQRIYGEEAETETVDTILEKAESSLRILFDNSYGLEVDSGKQDITVGRSGIGIAWSGDAVYSIELGEIEEDVSLYYAVPQTGGNIWFDGWVMQDYPGLNQEYAQKFVDFISRPDIASLNMDYIGYTPFIAGEDIMSLVRDWYDARSYAMYVYIDEGDYDNGYHDFLYDENGDKVFQNGSGVKEVDIDGEIYEADFGSIDMTGSSLEAPKVEGNLTTWEAYFEEQEWDVTLVDLSYFFEGTLTGDALVYSDELEEVTAENLLGEMETVIVGRGFYAQYPLMEMLPSLAVMEDYGENNASVLRIWEAVKSDSLEPWIIAVLVTETVLIAGGVLAFYFIKRRSRHLRKTRKKERESEALSSKA